jgi:predicted nucleic acid-binding protein
MKNPSSPAEIPTSYYAYIDSSALLRVIFAQKDSIQGLDGELSAVYSSELLKTECLRTVDRLHKSGTLSEDEMAEKREQIFSAIEKISFIPVSGRVLESAGQIFPVPIGTLDAIHLSSALLLQQSERKSVLMLTHDVMLARAARSMGIKAVGC